MNFKKIMIFLLLLLISFPVFSQQNESEGVYDLAAQKEESYSYLLPFTLEIFPGAGFLYERSYYKSASFFLIKSFSIACFAYYYDRSYNHDYDDITEGRYNQNFILSSIGLVTTYTVSYIFLKEEVDKKNEGTLPLFDLAYDGFSDSYKLTIGYSFFM